MRAASACTDVSCGSQEDRGVSAGKVGEGEGAAEEGCVAWLRPV